MSLSYVSGDAISLFEKCETHKLLFHVVNCQGVMGSGIALQIKNRIPEAYDIYRIYHELGFLQLGAIPSRDGVVNLAAQHDYGRGQRQLNYGALAKCFQNVRDNVMLFDAYSGQPKVFVPYLMGCDRAGGDWEIVSEMLDFYFDDVIICKLD